MSLRTAFTLRATGVLFLLSTCVLAQEPAGAVEARRLLFATNYDKAAEAFRAIVRDNPKWAPGWDYLVRALLSGKHASEAYAAAEEALREAPNTAEVETAQGRVWIRKGKLTEAEAAFKRALAIEPNSANAIAGLARLNRVMSRFATAKKLHAKAHELAPDDADLTLTWASEMDDAHRAEKLAAWERVLALRDPTTERAESLRARLTALRALGSRRTEQLQAPYKQYQLKLVPEWHGPAKDPFALAGAYSVQVRFNNRTTLRLLLDTGASGLTLGREAAEKLGLEALENDGTSSKGIGDSKKPRRRAMLAESVRIGDLQWTNCVVGVEDQKQIVGRDGLIGTDFFEQFLVELDFAKRRITLTPYAEVTDPNRDESVDAGALPQGFTRFARVGHLLLLPTQVNRAEQHWFVLDTGSTSNIIDVAAAKRSTKTHDDDMRVEGLQGRVKKVYSADRAELTVAGMRQPNQDMVSLDLTRHSDEVGLDAPGIIGMNLLNQVVLTIDYRHGALRMVAVP